MVLLEKKRPGNYFFASSKFEFLHVKKIGEKYWEWFVCFARSWASILIRQERLCTSSFLSHLLSVNTRWLYLTGYLPHNQTFQMYALQKTLLKKKKNFKIPRIRWNLEVRKRNNSSIIIFFDHVNFWSFGILWIKTDNF